MSKFNGSLHPRGGAGRFAEKPQSGPEVILFEKAPSGFDLGESQVESDDDEEDWPPAPTVVTTPITGALAERIRMRLGADPAEQVFLVGEVEWGGYSEYTQENGSSFTIRCGDHEIPFAVESEDDALDPAHGINTTYRQLNDWLLAGEHPSALVRAALEPPRINQKGRFVSWKFRPKSELFFQVARQCHQSSEWWNSRRTHHTMQGGGRLGELTLQYSATPWSSFGSHSWFVQGLEPPGTNGFQKRIWQLDIEGVKPSELGSIPRKVEKRIALATLAWEE